jgi:L-ascorbate metabolism protein UlaG (beta-lactamase superfamily)
MAAGSLTFIGTATVLVRLGPFTFLTDPNFLHQGEHAKLGYGLRSRRLTQPAMTIAELPPLDFVVLSHHHGDHFDDVAAAELPKDVPIYTEPHAARKLGRQGFTNAIGMPTWTEQQLSRQGTTITLTALPGRHAPEPLQRLLPPVMGTLLEVAAGGGRPFRLYITGDTLYYDGLRQIAERFAGMDLCLIHLGGTRIAGILLTMDADQGLRCLRLVRPQTAIPIHYDDYTVFKSPLADFTRAVGRADLDTEIVELGRGESYRFEVPEP